MTRSSSQNLRTICAELLGAEMLKPQGTFAAERTVDDMCGEGIGYNCVQKTTVHRSVQCAVRLFSPSPLWWPPLVARRRHPKRPSADTCSVHFHEVLSRHELDHHLLHLEDEEAGPSARSFL